MWQMFVRQTAQALLLLTLLAACSGYDDGDDYGPTGPVTGNHPADSPPDPEGNPPPPPADPY